MIPECQDLMQVHWPAYEKMDKVCVKDSANLFVGQMPLPNQSDKGSYEK